MSCTCRAGQEGLLTGAQQSHSGKQAHLHVTHDSHLAPEYATCHNQQHHNCLPTQKQCLTAGGSPPCSPISLAGRAHLLCYSERAIFLALEDAGIRVVGHLPLGGSVYAAQVVAGEASVLCKQAAWSAGSNHQRCPKCQSCCSILQLKGHLFAQWMYRKPFAVPRHSSFLAHSARYTPRP